MSDTGLRASKKEQTRQAIAGAGLRLFLTRGFDSVSIAEIAAAANVSKMTVFNYFPAKEDIFLSFLHDGRLAAVASAVRSREADETPLNAVHRMVRRDLRRHAEWTGLHDGVAAFFRVIFQSPTLMNSVGKVWDTVSDDLTTVLAEARGIPMPAVDGAEQASRLLAVEADDDADAARIRDEILGTLDPDAVRLRVAVGQIVAVLQNLVMVNLLRQILGQSAAEAEEASLRECDDAFRGLIDGLGAEGF